MPLKICAIPPIEIVVERRQEPRFAADLSGILSRLSGPEPELRVLIEDISEGGVRFWTAEALDCGSFVLVRIEDSTLVGEVKYCHPSTGGYIAGVLVERVLMGESPLARLLESMLTAP